MKMPIIRHDFLYGEMYDRRLTKECSLPNLAHSNSAWQGRLSNRFVSDLFLCCQVNRCLWKGDTAMKEGYKRDEDVGRNN